MKFHAGMACHESQPFIKTTCIETRTIRCQLYQAATPIARALDDPFHQACSNALAPEILANPDRFHLRPPRSLRTQARNERKLQRCDDFAVQRSHHHFIIRMRRYGVEGFDLRRRCACLLIGRVLRKGIVQDQVDDCIQVLRDSPSDFESQFCYFSTDPPFAVHSDMEPSYMLTS